MRIAIVDPRIHVPGLVKLFPEADYYVIPYNERYDLNKSPDHFYNLYRFRYREDLESITKENYDVIFIVYACYDFRDKTRGDVQYHLGKLLEILERNPRTQIVGFSNDDSPFDPAIDCNYLNANIWFKRNFESITTYSPHVYPFPFILFGHICPLWRVLTAVPTCAERIDRILWAGYNGPRVGLTRNKKYLSRHQLIRSRMRDYITKINLPNDEYIRELSRSMYALDMNGEGDPNYRTSELLMTDALIIQQFKYLVWPFEDGDAFCEETIYKTPVEFIEKLGQLRADPDLYKRCLNQQKHIKEKYFSAEWLRNYIVERIASYAV